MPARRGELIAAMLELIAAIALSVILAAQAAATSTTLHRGINIHTAMNWAALDRSSGRYVFPPFVGNGYDLRDEELRRLHAAGFDFVRLTVDPGPFLQFQGRERDALDEILVDRVRRIAAAGMATIVDFHPNTQHKSYRVELYVGDPGDPFVVAFGELLTRTARLLAGLKTDSVALELLNEPWTSGFRAAARWQTTLEYYHAAARRGAPDLQLILTGGDGGSAKGLIDLDPTPFRGSNVVFTFHCYAPLAFTNQGDRGPKTGDLVDVPYPLDPRPSVATLDAIRARIQRSGATAEEEARRFKVAEDYLVWAGRRGPRSLQPGPNFDAVIAWSKRHQIPRDRVLLGEFGVARQVGPYNGAPEADRLKWLAEVRTLAERAGFPWAYWAYRAYSGMMLVREPDSDAFDEPTIAALGLRDSADARSKEK